MTALESMLARTPEDLVEAILVSMRGDPDAEYPAELVAAYEEQHGISLAPEFKRREIEATALLAEARARLLEAQNDSPAFPIATAMTPVIIMVVVAVLAFLMMRG